MNTGPLSPHRDDPAGTSAVTPRDRGIVLIGRAPRLDGRGSGNEPRDRRSGVSRLPFAAGPSRLSRHGLRIVGRTTGGTPAAVPAAPSVSAVVSGGS
jgi:hypothetical protein